MFIITRVDESFCCFEAYNFISESNYIEININFCWEIHVKRRKYFSRGNANENWIQQFIQVGLEHLSCELCRKECFIQSDFHSSKAPEYKHWLKNYFKALIFCYLALYFSPRVCMRDLMQKRIFLTLKFHPFYSGKSPLWYFAKISHPWANPDCWCSFPEILRNH